MSTMLHLEVQKNGKILITVGGVGRTKIYQKKSKQREDWSQETDWEAFVIVQM